MLTVIQLFQNALFNFIIIPFKGDAALGAGIILLVFLGVAVLNYLFLKLGKLSHEKKIKCKRILFLLEGIIFMIAGYSLGTENGGISLIGALQMLCGMALTFLAVINRVDFDQNQGQD